MPRLRAQEIDDLRAFGTRLRDARARKGLTQGQLAFEGCTPAYLSRMESGDRAPSLEVIRQLAERLDVSEQYLVGIEASTSPLPSLDLLDAEVAIRLNQLDEAARRFTEIAANASGSASHVSEGGLGRVALAQNDLSRAIQLLERSVREWPLGAGPVPTRIVEALAEAYLQADMDARAHELISELRPDSSTLSLRVLEGVLGARENDLEIASSRLRSAAHDGQQLITLRSRAEAEWMHARDLRSRRFLRDAAVHFHRALAIADLMDDVRSLGEALGELVALGACDEDVRHNLRVAITALESSGETERALELRGHEAKAALAAGDKRYAEQLAAELQHLLQNPATATGLAWLRAADVFSDLGDASAAIEAYQSAIKLLDANASSDTLVTAYRRLAELLKAADRTTEAFALLEEALALTDRVSGQAVST
jgi:transcriptional regulator with XRE-family HTH domain